MADEPEVNDAGSVEEAQPKDPLDGQEDLQRAALALILKLTKEDMYPRLSEVRDVNHSRLYWRGQQYIWWSNKDQRVYTAGSNGILNLSDLNVDDMPHFEYVTNIYHARGLGFVGAMSEAVPETEFFPRDASNPLDIEEAAAYEKLAELLKRWNPPRLMMHDEAHALWCDGVFGLYTEYVEDGELYGFEEVGGIAEGQEMGEDGVATTMPVEAEKEELPRGRQTISVWGALNLRRPSWARNQSEFNYLGREREVHYSYLRHKYPDVGDKIKPGDTFGTDGLYERNARMSLLEGTLLRAQSAGAQAVLTTEAIYWVRPSAFRSCEPEIRDRFLEIFPRGACFEFAGHTFLCSRNESMDDCWVVRHGLPGDGQHRPAVGSDMKSPQDRLNTLDNISAETYEYGIPITYRDRATFDEEADEDQRSEPGSEIPVIVKPGEDIRQKIMQVRADSVSPDMVKNRTDLIGPDSDLLSGMFPGLTGAQAEGAAGETASGYAQQLGQAKGRIGIPYGVIKNAHDEIYLLSCRCLKKECGKDKLSWPVKNEAGEFEAESVDITALKGEAEVIPETDEAFPESWAMQRATFMGIMDTPYGQALVQEPENAELAVKLIGIPDLVIPGADDKDKTLRDIAELTRVLPGEQGSLPVQIQIDDVVDNCAAQSAIAKRFLKRLTGQKLKQENPIGYQNVRNYIQANDQMVAQKAAAQVPPTKPLAESLNIAYKDLPPEAQAQILSKFQIQVSPQDFLAKAALDKISKTPAGPPIQGIGAPPSPNQGAPPNARGS